MMNKIQKNMVGRLGPFTSDILPTNPTIDEAFEAVDESLQSKASATTVTTSLAGLMSATSSKTAQPKKETLLDGMLG